MFWIWYTGWVPPERKVQFVPISEPDWVRKDFSIENN